MEWLQNNVPDIKAIDGFSASEAMDYKVRLQTMPRVFSAEQRALVEKAIEACIKRLEELEIEGLIVQFNALTKESKRVFIKKIYNELIKYVELKH